MKYTSAHWGSYRITDTGLEPVASDPEPAVAGQGWLSSASNPATRIARPAIREGWLASRDTNRTGDAGFVELPWDEALDIVAGELNRVRNLHGNSAIYAGSYGWASAGRFHHAQSQLKRFLNCIGGCAWSRNTYSHAGAEVLWPHITGVTNRDFTHDQTSWDQIADHCRLLVAFGGISPRTAQISSGGTSSHGVRAWLDQMRSGQCRMINISPMASDLEGAEWLSIRPGTDRALILALSHVILSRGLEDRDFLARCTVGADRCHASVTGKLDGIVKTPAWAARICGIPAPEIEALALAMAENPTMISMAWSLQRQDRGEETIWAAFNLACLLGQIGQPGCGYGFGYGSMNTSGRPVDRWAWPSLPQGHNPVQDFIPVARITEMLENPGGTFRYNGATYRFPDTRLIWWAGGNPFHHHQDLNRLARAWQRPDTVIVNEHSWTATARRADIVLPCTSPLEREDMMMMRKDPALVFMSPARLPFGEARNDYDIFADLADRMGVAETHGEGRSLQDWLRWLWDKAQAGARERGIALPDYETFRDTGWFNLPDAAKSTTVFADFVKAPGEHALATPSGRFEMASDVIGAMGGDTAETPGWTEPVEGLGGAEADELHLISAQPLTRLHAQNDSGAETRAHKVKDREVCRLHPDTATRYGLAEGDVAELFNARGACLTAVAITADIRPDCVELPTGAWMDTVEMDGRLIEVHGNPNVLTLDKGSSELSQGNSAHTTLVRLRKWQGNLPPVQVFDGPRFVMRPA
ncbi:Asp-tRNA(Asn)/Glu-tRNA(Gln) amidotransferase GatCAB subunit C [Rhodophyticola sp. CCM32]|uniref:molybdopterin-dependent oxidoreductase n=1 Tax=Rhodophyticola sp. CCM32 TaxID=2916397 RepID=UPI00107F8E24|nr:molybdopterin-dependent oxidoreductase [Rhodophyticola sp. CCM32]QBY00795.1 Asp-tRNA(Asn)/Glu-tRNA(Gln) amidotransferase GatCAB subunit C [Rhodophyticola sp. CCM32]